LRIRANALVSLAAAILTRKNPGSTTLPPAVGWSAAYSSRSRHPCRLGNSNHTQPHTATHTYIHTATHAQLHTHSYTHTATHSRVRTYINACLHTQSHATYKATNTHTHTCYLYVRPWAYYHSLFCL